MRAPCCSRSSADTEDCQRTPVSENNPPMWMASAKIESKKKRHVRAHLASGDASRQPNQEEPLHDHSERKEAGYRQPRHTPREYHIDGCKGQ
jgi:hypothetical protein